MAFSAETYALLNKKLKGVVSGIASITPTSDGKGFTITCTNGSSFTVNLPYPSFINYFDINNQGDLTYNNEIVVLDNDYVHTDNNFTDVLKDKLESLTNSSRYIGLFNTYADLLAHQSPMEGDWATVDVDETHDNRKTKYYYNDEEYKFDGYYQDATFGIDDTSIDSTQLGWSARKLTEEFKKSSDFKLNYWTPNTEYDEFDYVVYNRYLYQAKEDFTSSTTFEESKFNVVLSDRYEFITQADYDDLVANNTDNPDIYYFIINGTSSGGGTSTGGTSNYNELNNKPKIEGITLQGDKSFEDIGIDDLEETEINNLINSL